MELVARHPPTGRLCQPTPVFAVCAATTGRCPGAGCAAALAQGDGPGRSAGCSAGGRARPERPAGTNWWALCYVCLSAQVGRHTGQVSGHDGLSVIRHPRMTARLGTKRARSGRRITRVHGAVLAGSKPALLIGPFSSLGAMQPSCGVTPSELTGAITRSPALLRG